jgi:poly(3-hydroxybutyrate) depolymerase
MPTEALAQFVRHTITSSGTSRDFFTYLPTGYSPQRAYRTIFAFHPCGGSGNPTSNIPIQNESKQDAIIISPQSKGNCYDNQIRNSPDVTFFDDALAYAEANYCVDESRVFAIGYSAGAWMSIILGCERANVIRAHAQVSGGLSMFVRPGECRGSVGAMFIHDLGDPTNTVNGGIAGRDRVVRMNQCGTATMPYDPAPCVSYQQCKPGYPVIWCPTMGKGHDRQDSFAPAPIWKFLSQF